MVHIWVFFFFFIISSHPWCRLSERGFIGSVYWLIGWKWSIYISLHDCVSRRLHCLVYSVSGLTVMWFLVGPFYALSGGLGRPRYSGGYRAVAAVWNLFFFFFFLRVVLGLGLSHVLAHLLWSCLNEGFLSWHLANLGFGFQTIGHRIVLSFV